MKPNEYLGKIISFKYKGGRKVAGAVEGVLEHNQLLLRLTTDYIGKNDEWYIGETKSFNFKEMKKIAIVKN